MTEDEVADTRAAYLSSKSLRPASTSSSDPASSQLPEYKEVELPNDQQLAEFVAELASTVVADAQANLAKPSVDPAAASHLVTGHDLAPGNNLAVVPDSPHGKIYHGVVPI
ncbi:hypothetical protein HaLaN_32261 [Haematococcus lacustris]|uniref:Uncharacterized protein n=1 Tax=Haematococcus lacustris TaxID=44745 RepID=A0A6A0AK40_HAELA|nr:hypothetical protein HaLaN_32261 [Haematococcus lacustris]